MHGATNLHLVAGHNKDSLTRDTDFRPLLPSLKHCAAELKCFHHSYPDSLHLVSQFCYFCVILQLRGVVALYQTELGHKDALHCFDCAVVGDVPLGGGLSSSASLEVSA